MKNGFDGLDMPLLVVYLVRHNKLFVEVFMGVTYLTENEIVERYGRRLSRAFFSQRRHRRQPPAYLKFGSRVLYPLDAVEEWEKSNRIDPEATR